MQSLPRRLFYSEASSTYHHHYHQHHQPTTSTYGVATGYGVHAWVLGDLKRGVRARVCVVWIVILTLKEFVICKTGGKTGILEKDKHLIFPVYVQYILTHVAGVVQGRGQW